MVTDEHVRVGGAKVPNACFFRAAGLASDRLRGL